MSQSSNEKKQDKEAKLAAAQADLAAQIKSAEEKRHSHQSSTEDVTKELSGTSTQISIIRLVNSLIATAFEARASDIHFDPEENQIRVRFRIDGALHDNFIF